MSKDDMRKVRHLYLHTSGFQGQMWLNVIISSLQYLANLFCTAYGYQYIMESLIQQDLAIAGKGIALFFIGLMLSGILQAITTYLTRSLQFGISMNIREALLSSWLDAPAAQNRKALQGDLLTRYEEDAQNASRIFGAQLPTLVTPVIVCVVCVIAITLRSAIVGGVTLLSLVFVFLLNRKYAPKYRKAGREIQEASAEVTQTYKNMVDGAGVIRLFSAQNAFAEQSDHMVHRLYRSWRKDTGLRTQQGFLGNLLGYSSATVPLVVSGILVGLGKLAFSSILYIQKLASNLIWFTNSFLQELADFQKSLASVDRLMDGLAEEKECDTYGNELLEPHGTAIAVRDLTVCYDETCALKHVNLEVHTGQNVALVGHSGSGKSTFLKAVLQFEQYGGEIELFGKNVHAYAYQVFRDSISYISQDIKLFRASIYENILYGNRNATMEEVIQAAKLSYADEFIQKLDQGYETVLNESGVSLSGGQLQRLAIARAFLKNAPVLLIDEATSALDPHSERQVTDAISLLSENRTVITVSHRLSTIEHADRIFVFDHQTLVEAGTHDELLQKHGAYYELHH